MNRRSIVGLLAAGGALAGCHQIDSVLSRPAAPAPGTRPLEDIRSVGGLLARFVADAGRVRLVLLVSPT